MSPTLEKILAVVLGFTGLAGVLVLYLWITAPRCPRCGRRVFP